MGEIDVEALVVAMMRGRTEFNGMLKAYVMGRVNAAIDSGVQALKAKDKDNLVPMDWEKFALNLQNLASQQIMESWKV